MRGGPETIIVLDWGDLAIATALVLVAGIASIALRLRMERRLGLAALRTIVQLLLVGYVLNWIFGIEGFWVLLPVLVLMIVAATHTAVTRPSRSFPGASLRSFLTLVAVGMLVTFTATKLIIAVEPWYAPRYLIPLLGMVLGNSMTALALCMDQLLETLGERRGEVETELALGATRWEAARGPLGDAVRRGMIPIINSMMVVGLVQLPGMMTGQILAGADPVVAVKYQIMIMFMLAAGSSLAAVAIALLIYQRLFNRQHQLRAERIHRRSAA
ncbi:MAG: iron export ABC transporter permease subunit FetB [Candidatus Eisenbacteria bacterium]|nr:iron export ABC transporter permease subunit FetB [Candidatus Eisenbacteria bacterium]